ncbi:MAG: fumarate hydratase [Eubacteriales bacterium]|nr:fumarate hydratase [Eubacteriales bacterium]MDD4078423.1 fumarate hydratase [Eubacteriales bacterium]MDD4768314.1 fumarate hydratase [Eubacteriales bacterium]
MRIKAEKISAAVAQLCIEANRVLPDDVCAALAKAAETEESPVGRQMLSSILENARIARTEQMPICQDTGMAVVFVELGQELKVEGDLYETINAGVAKGYTDGYLRKSVVRHPLDRVNTGDNTPAIVHLRLVPGNKMKITVAPKGFGSENMGGLAMLKPAQGRKGVVDFVTSVVESAGANPCPPIIVGVGLGGTMEYATYLAKRALLREVGTPAAKPLDRELEIELEREINQLGIGPQGFGGTVTTFAVHVESYPTHIAGLPVAVNINCHAARHKEIVLEGEEE